MQVWEKKDAGTENGGQGTEAEEDGRGRTRGLVMDRSGRYRETRPFIPF